MAIDGDVSVRSVAYTIGSSAASWNAQGWYWLLPLRHEEVAEHDAAACAELDTGRAQLET